MTKPSMDSGQLSLFDKMKLSSATIQAAAIPAADQNSPADGIRKAKAPKNSDEALALEFAMLNEDHLRYVAARNKWMVWKGDHWAPDDTNYAVSKVRAVCRAAAKTSRNNPTKARHIASAKTVSAVERLARSDPRLTVTNDIWDTNPWLFNTPMGVVNLKTGCLQPHDPQDYLTKIGGAVPGGKCPIFDKFIDRVTGGDKDYQYFLQRLFGYVLSGDTSAQAMFFIYGTGANGKSVLLETLAGILGDYHTTAPSETFLAGRGNRHPTELARLQNVRLVTAVETEKGCQWSEARIKNLTGGDRIAARRLYEDYFEFVPQLKLVMAGNYKPKLSNVDEAIQRRLVLLPFEQTIPPAERDPQLQAKMKEEWPGILQWMIEGCIQYQKNGLQPPRVVTEATKEYLEAEDAIMCWIKDHCIEDPMAYATNDCLWDSWCNWATCAGVNIVSRVWLVGRLKEKGFKSVRKKNIRGFQGINLKNATSATLSNNLPMRARETLPREGGTSGSN